MTQDEFNELEAAISAMANQDVQLARLLTMLLTLLVRALPVQGGV